MNLKLRLKNKVTLLAIVGAAVAFLYQVAGILGIVVPVSEEQAIQVASIIINLMVGLGVLVDPTTAGVKDSARALTYEEPSRVTIPDAHFPAGGESAAGYTEMGQEALDPEDPEV